MLSPRVTFDTFPGDSSPGRGRARRTYRAWPALFLLVAGCGLAQRRGCLDDQAAGEPRHRRSQSSSLMPPRWFRVFPPLWWALGGWLTGSPVGYGLTGSVAGGPEPRVRGRTTAAGPGGGAAPWGASVAPPPLFPPVEPTPATSAEPREHSHPRAPATRKRVVLLPHAPIQPIDTRTHNRHRTPQ